MKSFKGIKARTDRQYDRCEVTSDGPAVIIGVMCPGYKADAAMALTPQTARAIAAELIRLADMIEVMP